MIFSWPVITFLISINLTKAFVLDSVKLWNDSQLVCGYPVDSIKDAVWADMLQESTQKIRRNQQMTSNQQPQKIQIKNVVISYEVFLCCLKNIWISVKNNAQKQKCLKFFLKCVKTSFEKGCKIPWTYYINLAVHDLRVATLLVVTSAIFFVTTVILVEKCKQDQYDSFMEITR